MLRFCGLLGSANGWSSVKTCESPFRRSTGPPNRSDEGICEPFEVFVDEFEVFGRALAAAVLDVAEVKDETHLRIGIDLGDVVGEVGDLRRPVGGVTDNRVGHRLGGIEGRDRAG